MRNNGFIEKFEKYSIKHKLFNSGEKILIGFSGGADSTALMLALWHLKSKYGYSILASHVNYNLRENDSKLDEEFVRKFCFDRNISLVIKNVNITPNSNIENHARELRFDYFNSLRTVYKIQKIALGHNREDQAETLLFRMFRGSGYTGIRGISPITDDIVHPLLSFSREEIVTYLKSENIQWREDLSNEETTFTRNKIRHNMIPWIKEHLNPNVVNKLFEAAEIFSETDDILTSLASRRLLKALIKQSKNECRLSVRVIKKTKPVLRYYVYKEAYSRINGDSKDFYHNNFIEIENLLSSNGSKQIFLPNNIFVFKEYNEFIFTNIDISKFENSENEKEITSLRSRFTFEDKRIIMKKLKKMPTGRSIFENKNIAYIDLDKTNFPLRIRHRKQGDRFHPLGMKHSKKIKDFLIDEKVPKFDRDKVLIFCDHEKIIWLAGHRIDDRVVTMDDTQNILYIKIEKIAQKKMRAAERINKK
ncbi:MAG: tRNA lysidine(34) synthetase TilS [Candidatus Tenebribacter davisii]|jgi:tRNA(Ile)-lysidine synthase|nr:tRNA lysidine(34) synthetase TilS [Candidatus Tenebribacter davisii]